MRFGPDPRITIPASGLRKRRNRGLTEDRARSPVQKVKNPLASRAATTEVLTLINGTWYNRVLNVHMSSSLRCSEVALIFREPYFAMGVPLIAPSTAVRFAGSRFSPFICFSRIKFLATLFPF